MRIVRYLGQAKGAVALVVLLLLVQAFADLSLPKLTSDLVDVGIQQSGVENASPAAMRAETFDAVCAGARTPDDAELVRASYDRRADGAYALNEQGERNRAALDAAVAEPLARAVFQGGFDESLAVQQAVAAVRVEYEALGMDVSGIQMSYLVGTGLRMLSVAAVMMAATIGVGFVASRAAARIAANLRRRLFERVVSFSDAEVRSFGAASLITRGTNDVQQIQMLLTMLLRMVLYAPILAVGGIFMISQTDVSMSWIVALAVGVIAVVVVALMAVVMPKFKMVQQLIDRVNLVSREMLTGLPVIRAFDRQQYEEERFDDASAALLRTQLFTNRAMALMMPAMMLVMNGVSVLIVWVGGHAIDAGELQTGDMIAFITYAMVIIMSFLILGMISVMLPRAAVAAQRVDEVLGTESSIEDPVAHHDALAQANGLEDAERVQGGASAVWAAEASAVRTAGASAAEGGAYAAEGGAALSEAAPSVSRTECRGAEIAFNHVTFSYDEGSDPVLEDITFTARPGKTTAIIGPTGSGKSTIVKLIERFYDVSEGPVTLDGVDVRDMPQHELRANLGYVPQKAFLFKGTIETAITCGDDRIDRATVERAAAIAQASDFIAEKEGGFDAEVSQGGTNVSGGQRQRLAIARALATGARAFLFDDSFSALDYKTDAQVRAALARHVGGRTVVIVAQRISTVLNADLIVVVEEGRVVGQGTHAQLLATCPTYREIAESQLSLEELGSLSCDEEAATCDGAAFACDDAALRGGDAQ